MVWTAPDITRVDEPFNSDERATLDGFLNWYRATLLHKCAGLTGEQLARRAVPPSTLSLLGLIRHMTEVERNWFRRRFADNPDLPHLYIETRGDDRDFDDLDPERAEAEYGNLVAEQKRCAEAVAGYALADTFTHTRFGDISLRWLYTHMIEEYSRHCGHADLLRECIDGVTETS